MANPLPPTFMQNIADWCELEPTTVALARELCARVVTQAQGTWQPATIAEWKYVETACLALAIKADYCGNPKPDTADVFRYAFGAVSFDHMMEWELTCLEYLDWRLLASQVTPPAESTGSQC